MATAKKTTKKAMPKSMSKAEYTKFFGYIGKARVMARKLSQDANRRSDVRAAMRSIEKKLWNIGNDYRWGALTDYNSKI